MMENINIDFDPETIHKINSIILKNESKTCEINNSSRISDMTIDFENSEMNRSLNTNSIYNIPENILPDDNIRRRRAQSVHIVNNLGERIDGFTRKSINVSELKVSGLDEPFKMLPSKKVIIGTMDKLLSNDIEKIRNLRLNSIKVINFVTKIAKFCSFNYDIISSYVALTSVTSYYNMKKHPQEWDGLNKKKKEVIRRLYAFVINKDAIIYLNSIFNKTSLIFAGSYIYLPNPKYFWDGEIDQEEKNFNEKNKMNVATRSKAVYEEKKLYYFKNNNFDVKKLQKMTAEMLGFVGELNIEETCMEMKNFLKQVGINSKYIGRNILGLEICNSINYFLSSPAKWEGLTDDKKIIYIRMRALLNLYKEIEEMDVEEIESQSYIDQDDYVDDVDYSFLDIKESMAIVSKENETANVIKVIENNGKNSNEDTDRNIVPKPRLIRNICDESLINVTKRRLLEDERINNKVKRTKTLNESGKDNFNIINNRKVPVENRNSIESMDLTDIESCSNLSIEEASINKINKETNVSINNETIMNNRGREKTIKIEDDITEINIIKKGEVYKSSLNNYSFNKPLSRSNIDENIRNKGILWDFYRTTVFSEYFMHLNSKEAEVLVLSWTYNSRPPQSYKVFLSEMIDVSIDTIETFNYKVDILYSKESQNFINIDEFKNGVRSLVVENTSRKTFISITNEIFKKLLEGVISQFVPKVQL
uniref:CUT domain-containing protein n=1 Tax=Parastrongyloides trichosuri TaxID=131310 RepID=A0A0N4Z8H3_PARTI